MKKIYLGVALLLAGLFLVGCSLGRTLEINDFKEKIRAGMTPSEVKWRLGKPIRINDHNEEVIEQWEEDNEYTIDMWTYTNNDYFDFFFGEKQEYFFEKTDQETGWSYYEYEHTWEMVDTIDQFRIYFVDGEVVWMSFP